MQRTVYNVWGRQVKNRDEANARTAKALADNPKIQNLHIAIIPFEHYYSALKMTVIMLHYQARWYDRSVAIKEGKARRALKPVKKHVCNCQYCDMG